MLEDPPWLAVSSGLWAAKTLRLWKKRGHYQWKQACESRHPHHDTMTCSLQTLPGALLFFWIGNPPPCACRVGALCFRCIAQGPAVCKNLPKLSKACQQAGQQSGLCSCGFRRGRTFRRCTRITPPRSAVLSSRHTQTDQVDTPRPRVKTSKTALILKTSYL